MTSVAATVQDYTDSLDPKRREVFLRLRSAIAENLPAGFEEVMAWGMPTWVVPLKRFPELYEARVAKKADMGKSCLRFTGLDAIPYELMGEVAAWFDVDQWIVNYASLKNSRKRKSGKEEHQ
ncbi:MAG: DUF1801 domain-containing protein [Spirochaetia bacterium]|nr:DUF1801 domain-containing protein [Spirochaetia bacterium]